MSLVVVAKLFQEIFAYVDNQPERGQLSVDGLEITLKGEDSNLGHWLDRNFGFIGDDHEFESTDRFRVSTVCSDNWVQTVTQLSDTDQFASTVLLRGQSEFRRIQVSDELTLDYFPAGGLVWMTDRQSNSLVLIYSSRTIVPMLELRTGLIDIINRYLQLNQWHCFKAGAFKLHCGSSDRTFLVVGNSSKDVTALIVNLIRHNASYIGSDRLFVRKKADAIQVRAFPQSLRIDPGTLRQLKRLKPFLKRPDRLSYFQKEFEPDRVWSTPSDQLHELPDRLRILPTELTDSLQSPDPVSSGILDGIIFPQLDSHQKLKVIPVPAQSTLERLGHNYIHSDSDSLYPRWLQINYATQPQLDAVEMIRLLSDLPAWQLSFFVEKEDSEHFGKLTKTVSQLIA